MTEPTIIIPIMCAVLCLVCTRICANQATKAYDCKQNAYSSEQMASVYCDAAKEHKLAAKEAAGDAKERMTMIDQVKEQMTFTDQPPPIPNDRPAIADLVIQDMAERKRVGIERYGVPLQPFNGRCALVDAYQEALDLAVYLRQLIEEKKTPNLHGADKNN